MSDEANIILTLDNLLKKMRDTGLSERDLITIMAYEAKVGRQKVQTIFEELKNLDKRMQEILDNERTG